MATSMAYPIRNPVVMYVTSEIAPNFPLKIMYINESMLSI